MPIGDNIKKYRELRNMSVQELADKMDIGRAGIYKWENNENNPNQESLMALCKALDIQLNQLLDENLTPVDKANDNNGNGHGDPEVYRTIIEGKTEYSLIPRSVLDRTQLISMDQISKTWEELAEKNRELQKRDKQIDFLMELVRDLTVKGQGSEPATQSG